MLKLFNRGINKQRIQKSKKDNIDILGRHMGMELEGETQQSVAPH